MDLLWKKEANGSSYVNIFANIDQNSPEKMLDQLKIAIAVERNKKNNKHSTNYRLKGNEKVIDKDWRFAMRWYNLSLRFAEIGSENISLAYANRSFCFLKLGSFDKCVVDIEMAIKCNYPKQKMSKLEKRRAYCLSEMKTGKQIEQVTPKLDFDADENFPGMANVLQLKYNKKFGRHFVAKCDIDVGKVVMVEKAFVTTIVMQPGENICDTCFGHMANFITCQRCTSGLFCDEICAKDPSHSLRCGRSSKDDNALVEFALRSICCAFDIFPNADSLMHFVESVIQDKTKTNDVPYSIVDMESKYRMFLKLNLWLGLLKVENLFALAQDVFVILMRWPDIKAEFSAKNKNRFLMHLCVLHTYIVFCNSFHTELTGGIYLLRNHFNHSCAPNLLCTTYENKSISITSRRVKKGDQLFISYGEMYWSQSHSGRQQRLSDDFGFQCKCERCENKNWPIPSNRIKSDEEFQKLAKELDKNIEYHNDVPKCFLLKQKCLEILIKYADLPWSTEKDLVSDFYQHLSMETII